MSALNCTTCNSIALHNFLMFRASLVLQNIDKDFFNVLIFECDKQRKKFARYQDVWNYVKTQEWQPSVTLATYYTFYKLALHNHATMPILSHLILMPECDFNKKCTIALFLHNFKHQKFTVPKVIDIIPYTFKGDCIVCHEKFAEYIAKDCGHVGVCHTCKVHPQFDQKSCPICRATTTSKFGIWRRLYNHSINNHDIDVDSHTLVNACKTYLSILIDMVLSFTPVNESFQVKLNSTKSNLGSFSISTLKLWCLKLSNTLDIKMPVVSENTLMRKHKMCDKCKLEEAMYFACKKQFCNNCHTTCKNTIKIQWA